MEHTASREHVSTRESPVRDYRPSGLETRGIPKLWCTNTACQKSALPCMVPWGSVQQTFPGYPCVPGSIRAPGLKRWVAQPLLYPDSLGEEVKQATQTGWTEGELAGRGPQPAPRSPPQPLVSPPEADPRSTASPEPLTGPGGFLAPASGPKRSGIPEGACVAPRAAESLTRGPGPAAAPPGSDRGAGRELALRVIRACGAVAQVVPGQL